MAFKPVFLWTDILIYLLLAAIVAFIFWSRRHEHLRVPWRQLLRNLLGVASMVILLTYVIIALLDSMHFRTLLSQNIIDTNPHYSTEVKSVLDYLLTPLDEHYEQSYSAPFATKLYVYQTVTNIDGTRVRVYPALSYGGSQLVNPQDKCHDIFIKSFKAGRLALVCWMIVCSLIVLRIAIKSRQTVLSTLKRMLLGQTNVAWRTLLLTLLVILILLFMSYHLSRFYHIFGTDKIGKDVFYEAIKSVRTGLIIGTLTTLVVLPFAVLLGMLAGYYSGWVDDVIQYIYTTLNSIPGVLLIAAAVLSLQVYIANHADDFPTLAHRADLRLLALCFILGITSWTGLCRMLRGETLKLREVDYIQAAKAFGVSNIKILLRHILPNVMHIILISVVLDFSALVLAEAVLSYVGVGVDPTMPSWGNMINAARLELAREPSVWWPLLASFVFMFALVLSANLFSDAVRDAFDPRMRKH